MEMRMAEYFERRYKALYDRRYHPKLRMHNGHTYIMYFADVIYYLAYIYTEIG